MSYLEKLKAKTSHPGELSKLPKAVELENMPTPPTAKTAKRPFDSKDSYRGRRFSGNQDPGTGLKIEPMPDCLYGGKCRHLDAPGGCRPVCKNSGKPVFDMDACPLNKWAGNLTN
jgi:hypothetical protein